MDYIDYREKLGLDFTDKDKQKFFFSRIKMFMMTHKGAYFPKESERKFCYQIGIDCVIDSPPLNLEKF